MSSATRYRDARSTLSASLLCVLLAVVTGVYGLKNVSIEIPMAVAAGTTVNMYCRYDLENDELYTVKWYKGQEFYRYIPKEMPPIGIFGEVGGKVLKNRSDTHRLVLKDLQPRHTGTYRCEVSGDAPDFTTIMVSAYMHVASLPNGDPELRVEKMRYAVGDTVRANCTVPAGYPPANVTWTVNGRTVNSSFVLNVTDDVTVTDDQGPPVRKTVAGLDFETMQDNFRNGRLHIVCNAYVFHLYQKKAEVILKEERPRLASVLGTRESSYIGAAAKSGAECFYVAAVTILLLCSLR